MPSSLALALTLALVFYGFLVERQRNPSVSVAAWIPTLWLILIGTRFASQWIALGTGPSLPQDPADGSPVDQAVFLGLYVLAVFVLIRRRIALSALLSNNVWLFLFLGYCLLSVLWSEYPWTALKRWVKVTEHLAMVLVVLTEADRLHAIDAVLRRFAYFALAMSVCFIKYFPQLGRGFDLWTGKAVNTGVTTDKNALGHLIVIGGTYLILRLLIRDNGTPESRAKTLWLLDLLMLAFAVWLLSLADAKTALVCFFGATAVIFMLSRPTFRGRPGRVLALLTLAVGAFAIFETLFELSTDAITALNRTPTLTDRTLVWNDVLSVKNNWLIGTGFESFWLGPRAEALWDKYWWRPNQAHNGYIETYINLGAAGVALLLAAIASAFVKALRTLPSDPIFGCWRLALLIAIVIFNYTDATFKAVHVLYFTFFLVALEYPPALPHDHSTSMADRLDPATYEPTHSTLS
jgi:exopolysaccharide production protein ExoQ